MPVETNTDQIVLLALLPIGTREQREERGDASIDFDPHAPAGQVGGRTHAANTGRNLVVFGIDGRVRVLRIRRGGEMVTGNDERIDAIATFFLENPGNYTWGSL